MRETDTRERWREREMGGEGGERERQTDTCRTLQGHTKRYREKRDQKN